MKKLFLGIIILLLFSSPSFCDVWNSVPPWFPGYYQHIVFSSSLTTPSWQSGLLFFDYNTDSLSFYNSNSEVMLNIGQEHWVIVRNTSGISISDFTPVYQTGATGPRANIAKAVADGTGKARVIGVTTHNLSNNENGVITVAGVINNVDTDGSIAGETWTSGTILYLDPDTAGGLTSVMPDSTEIVRVGSVLDPGNNGSFLVRIHNFTNIQMRTLPLTGIARSVDPADPVDGSFIIWMSDGTGSGDNGDILFKITAGGSTVTGTLIDKSTY